MLALTRPEDSLDPQGSDGELSIRLQCAANFRCAMDLRNDHDMKMFAKAREEVPELDDKRSQLLLLHATADDVVPAMRGETLEVSASAVR